MGEDKTFIVVDTNVLMAALIMPESPVWTVLELREVEFVVPEFSLSELHEYRVLIKEKLSKKGKFELFDFLLSELFKNITIIPEEMYAARLADAVEAMRGIDEKDSPFIALALTLKCPVWSNDEHFKQQKKAAVYKTEELIDEFFK